MKQSKLQLVDVEDRLSKAGMALFTPQDFSRFFGSSSTRTKYFLETYTKRGLFVRLKQGLYGLRRHLPREEEIANLLYRPSYISFEYALARHNIMPEMVYTITSATTKPTRTFTVGEKTFAYFKIKRVAYTGYAPVKLGNRTVLLAEPEKALVDYLYFVALGRKSLSDRLNISNLDRKKITKYARLYGHPRLMSLIATL